MSSLFSFVPSARAMLAAIGRRPSALASFAGKWGARLEVGADGVLVARLGTERFLPYRDLTTVTAEGERLTLSCRDGKTLKIVLAGGASTAATVLRSIEKTRLGEPAPPPRSFGPAGRSASEWAQALRDGAAASGYRESAWQAEELWAVVEDSGQDPAVRTGAAVALAPMLDARGRRRLRVVAQASASPRLRVSLEAAARPVDDPAALEQTLEPWAEQDRSRARPR